MAKVDLLKTPKLGDLRPVELETGPNWLFLDGSLDFAKRIQFSRSVAGECEFFHPSSGPKKPSSSKDIRCSFS
jgi:hypothetical protein